MNYAIIDNEGIVDEAREDEIMDIWNDDEKMTERDFKGRVLLVRILDEK